jgi:pheromone shutdown protein TraB
MQGSLDFAEAHPKELFKAADMGEDINRAIEKYRELEGRILAIVDREVGVTQKATDWAKSILRKKKG